MRKHECLESTEDYVRYLERRVELLELRSFVVANKGNLLRLCDRNDEYDISNFLEDMVKVS